MMPLPAKLFGPGDMTLVGLNSQSATLLEWFAARTWCICRLWCLLLRARQGAVQHRGIAAPGSSSCTPCNTHTHTQQQQTEQVGGQQECDWCCAMEVAAANAAGGCKQVCWDMLAVLACIAAFGNQVSCCSGSQSILCRCDTSGSLGLRLCGWPACWCQAFNVTNTMFAHLSPLGPCTACWLLHS